jgi:lipopolysaccharide heptosyltransferase II
MAIIKKILAKRQEQFFNFVREPRNVRRILLIKNGLIGDMVACTAVLSRLAETYPKVKIDIIAGPSSVPLLQGIPAVNRVFPFRYNFSLLSTLRQIAFFMRLRKYRYDLILVQETNPHFTLMAKLTGSRFSVGFSGPLSWLLDYAAGINPGKMPEVQISTVKAWTKARQSERLLIDCPETDKQAIAARLLSAGHESGRGFVILHPGASKPDSDRQWSVEGFAELAANLYDQLGLAVVFTGLAFDLPTIRTIRARLNVPSYSLASKLNLRELIALCSMADLVIAPDTGIIHIATALRVPAVMLMGISDPADTGPYSPDGLAAVARVELPCSPCINLDIKPEQWKTCTQIRPGNVCNCSRQNRSLQLPARCYNIKWLGRREKPDSNFGSLQITNRFW